MSTRCHKIHGARHGFTLVELLTVVAIIGVLATLLLSGVASAKKKSRTARCTANLHQISLAVTMYLDDHERRPPTLDPLVATKYLGNPQVLLCPEDKTGNWGGLVNPPDNKNFSSIVADGQTALPSAPSNAVSARFSYLHPLSWGDAAWDALLKTGSSASFVACQLHGLGAASPQPSIHDFEGLVLRGQRDGAVVRRKLFWPHQQESRGPDGLSNTATFNTPGSITLLGGGPDSWPFLTDDQQPAPQ
ncbi:MAG TPA: prepilin-type N-terminal cleavage/methylation domain-containing protein [Verrucomicrobiae bacterium]|nr:prepilin-type N-terminal cleavage/methylation domain-containing protein [Verrucomicrobiae bacterium]